MLLVLLLFALSFAAAALTKSRHTCAQPYHDVLVEKGGNRTKNGSSDVGVPQLHGHAQWLRQRAASASAELLNRGAHDEQDEAVIYGHHSVQHQAIDGANGGQHDDNDAPASAIDGAISWILSGLKHIVHYMF